MEEKKIIEAIERKQSSCYRDIAKDFLKKHYAQFNDLERAVFVEIICLLVEKHCSIQECFSKISEQYGINCEKIAFSAIKPLITVEKAIKTKLSYLSKRKEIILGCIMIMKMQVVNEAFRYDNSLT